MFRGHERRVGEGGREGELAGAEDDIMWLRAACLPPSRRKLTASPVAMVTCSKLPSEDGSVISDESERLRSGRSLMVLKVAAQQRATKEEARKKDGEREAALSEPAGRARRARQWPRWYGSHSANWRG